MMHEPGFEADDALLTAEEAARMLRMEPTTLANLRARGDGPPWHKLPSGAVRYSLANVLVWINAGGRGLTWPRLEAALADYDMPAAQRDKLLKHLRIALKD